MMKARMQYASPLRPSSLLLCLFVLAPSASIAAEKSVGGAAEERTADTFIADVVSGSCSDSLFQWISDLRSEGKQAEALETARDLLKALRRNPDAMPWQVGDAEREIETLESVARLSEKARREFALADSLGEVVADCWKSGRFTEGAAAAERQLEIQRRLLGEEHPEVAKSLNNLALLLKDQGNYAEAEPLLHQALAMHRKLVEKEHPEVATTLNNLACLLQDQGNYAAAETLYREALAMTRNLRGSEHLSVALNLNNLAVVLWYQGDYAGAGPLFREVLAMRRKLLGEEHPAVARILNNLAVLRNVQGDYAEAERLYRKALAILRKVLQADNHDVARYLDSLGNVLCARGDYAGAEPLFREALSIRRTLLGEEHPDVARSLNSLGNFLSAQGDYADAQALQREALGMRRRVLGEEHPDVAASLNDLADLLNAQGDYAGAAALYREALAIRRKALGGKHPLVARTLGNLGTCLLAQGNPAMAEPVLSEATSVFEAARLRVGGGFTRATFQTSRYLELAAARLMTGMTPEAWPAAERALGRALADLLIGSDQRSLNPSETVRENSLKKALVQLEGQVAALHAASRTDSTGETTRRYGEMHTRLLEAEAEWSSFQREIAGRYPVTEGQALPLERVQRSLMEQTALVGWLHVEIGLETQASWGYVIRRSGPVNWVRLEPSPQEDHRFSPVEKVHDFREALAIAGSWPFRVTTVTRTTADAQDVWAQWMAPLRPHLDGVEHLIAIPTGPMLGVPIEALVDSAGTYLGDIYTISYTPSASIYTWLQEQGAPRETQGAGRAFLVGDPPFTDGHLAAIECEKQRGESPAAGPRTTREPLLAGGAVRSALAGNEEALAALPRLPATREEVVGVAAVIPGATILLGPEASEQNIARMAESGTLREFDTIHLATHALVDAERPERSALVFSRVNLPDPLEATITDARIFDGLVMAKDIVREWDLNAKLVTLSGCQTGLGRKTGGEGYIGLAHAFFQAGARSLLVSLWRIEDEATSLLMKRFYQNLTGTYQDERGGSMEKPMSVSRALREAKHWLRNYTNEEGRQPFWHPAYWSGFVLIGNP